MKHLRWRVRKQFSSQQKTSSCSPTHVFADLLNLSLLESSFSSQIFSISFFIRTSKLQLSDWLCLMFSLISSTSNLLIFLHKNKFYFSIQESSISSSGSCFRSSRRVILLKHLFIFSRNDFFKMITFQ